jgi:2,3-dihydroxybenzoate-AMP ligase
MPEPESPGTTRAPSPISAHTVPWPEADAARYIANGYWAGIPFGDLLREAADRTPDAPALADPDAGVRLTYAELAGRADALAGRLLDLGLVPGDRIVVQLPNGWEFLVLTWACLRSGIVPVMALPAHRRNELSYLAEHSEAAAIAVPASHRAFDHQALAHQLEDGVKSVTRGPWHVLVAGDTVLPGSVDLRALCAAPEDAAAARARLDALKPGSRDVAVFLLSGGTTGRPKLIARTHDDYAYNARASAEVADVTAASVYLVSLPAGHNFPLACPGTLGTLLAGGTVVMLPSPDPERAFAAIDAEGVTHTAVVPAVAGRWLEHAAAHPADGAGAGQLASLRVLQVGGARIADELASRIEPVLGARLQQVFGMAEGLLNYTRLHDPLEVIIGTQGRPMCPADEIRLVDETDQDVPAGAPGSLLTRGPYTPRGYYRAAEQNTRAFTPAGWYRSGDICRLTPEGNLIVEGRDKDMINRGGENISAEEVENLVYRIPEVSQVAAVAMPDPVLGERVCVYVVPKPGSELTLERVRAAMETHGVARYKVPEHLVLADSLPATKVGKIDKKALRADIAARLGNADSSGRSG